MLFTFANIKVLTTFSTSSTNTISPTSKTKKNKATIQKPKLDYCLIFVYILFISIILGILLIVKNNILFGFSLSIISFVLKFITYKEKGIYSNFTLD